MKPRYEKLSDELQERILSDRENNVDYNLAFDESEILRRDKTELRSGVQQR